MKRRHLCITAAISAFVISLARTYRMPLFSFTVEQKQNQQSRPLQKISDKQQQQQQQSTTNSSNSNNRTDDDRTNTNDLETPPKEEGKLTETVTKIPDDPHSSSSIKIPLTLRFNWSDLPPLSPLAQRFARTQSQCRHDTAATAETGNPTMTIANNGLSSSSSSSTAQIYPITNSGMGSALHIWSQWLCWASENGTVLATTHPGLRRPWIWYDQARCQSAASLPPLGCYFRAESAPHNCSTVQNNTFPIMARYRTVILDGPGSCPETLEEHGFPGVRAAAMEYLFSSMTPIMIEEAERQLKEAFGDADINDLSKLVTIHLRWGDKGQEMDLASIEEYINGTQSLLTPAELAGTEPVWIYLATEDPSALQAFKKDAPSTWTIFATGPKNQDNATNMLVAGRKSKGSAGLTSIAALLVAMEANRYVFTLGSNWSRIMDELRKQVVNPRCNNCTKMVDLRPPGTEWM